MTRKIPLTWRRAPWKVTSINQAGKDAPADFIEKADLKMTFKDGGKLLIDSGRRNQGRHL